MEPRKKTGLTALQRRLAIALVAMLATVGLSFGTVAPAQADAASVKQAVVHLQQDWGAVVRFTNPENKKTADITVKVSTGCTGFFVNAKGAIATAGHCVDKEAAKGPLANAYKAMLENEGYNDATVKFVLNNTDWVQIKLLRVWAYQPNELDGVLDNSGIQVQVVDYDPLEQGDHALLKLNNFAKETPFLHIADARPAEQAKVTAVGFPGDVTFTSDSARQNASFKQGVISSFQTFNGVPFTEVDAGMEPGMSGGPVLNENEEVIGVVSWGTNDAKTVNFATDTESLRSFLIGQGVDLTSAPAPQPDATPGSTDGPAVLPTTSEPASGGGVPVGVVVGILAAVGVLGGGGFFLYTRKNKAGPKRASTDG